MAKPSPSKPAGRRRKRAARKRATTDSLCSILEVKLKDGTVRYRAGIRAAGAA